MQCTMQEHNRCVRAVDLLCTSVWTHFSILIVPHIFLFRPELSEDTMCIEIENGRHPIVSSLLTGEVQFVPNSTHMEVSLYLFEVFHYLF